MNPNDEYSAALESDDYKAWKGEEVPAPVVPEKEEEAKSDRPRNPDGTFAKAEEAVEPKAEEAKPDEPFKGFNDLSPEAQAYFNRLKGEADDYKVRYTRQLGHTRQLARQTSASQKAPAGKTAQQVVSGMPPGEQRQAAQKQLDKWEAHAKAYPDDAAAIEQLLTAFRDELVSGVHPLAQELNALKSELGEFADVRDALRAMQAERAERIAQESQAELTKVAGDNWRQIAGWEDEHGNPIPPDKRDWHPEFRAWVEGHDPDMQEHLWQTLAHSSPKVAGRVFAEFNRERFGLDAGAQEGQSTPADPVAARRAEALRDTQPGSARAKTSSTPTWTPSGDPYADALMSEAYREWQKA